MLRRLGSGVEQDLLIFWGDLIRDTYNGPLRNEIVRVSIFENGTYRIARYDVSGIYGHAFYIKVASENPLEGIKVFEKPYRGFAGCWANIRWYNGTIVWDECYSTIING